MAKRGTKKDTITKAESFFSNIRKNSISKKDSFASLTSLTPKRSRASTVSRKKTIIENKSLTIDEAINRAGGFGNHIFF